jgi:putative SOS response-associated peptidase YedK
LVEVPHSDQTIFVIFKVTKNREMCYNAEAQYRDKLRYALLRGDVHLAEEIQRKLDNIEIEKSGPPLYFANGFSHPKLLVFTNEKPEQPQFFTWGLIPGWCKDWKDAVDRRRKLLNARSESMFDLPSFKSSARNKRCLVYVDAFYEYHSVGKKKYPFRIALQSGEPMIMAGLWNDWADKETGEIHHSFAIVTSPANPLMSRVHNLPANSEDSRMPVILPKEKQEEWLMDIKTDADKQHILDLCVPCDESLLEVHTVAPLIGKAGLGNVPEARNEYRYAELDYSRF